MEVLQIAELLAKADTLVIIFVSFSRYSNLSQREVNPTQNPSHNNHFKDLTAAKLPSQPPSYALAKLVDATNAQWAKMARKYLK